MSSLPGTEPAIVEFLLGGLTPEERERLEEQAFTDDAVHEQLEATADDLIHAYLAGALPATDRRRFEVYFLASPRRRERLRFLQQLVVAVGRVANREPVRLPRWRPLPALAAVATGAILLGLLWRLGLPLSEPRSAPRGARPSVEASPSPTLSAEPRKDRGPLRAGVRVVRPARGQPAPTTVDLRDQPRALRFEVAVEEGALSFDAVIRAADGAEVWSAEEIPPPDAGRPLVVTVPASAFAGAGDRYSLRVEPEALRNDGPGPSSVEYALRAIRR